MKQFMKLIILVLLIATTLTPTSANAARFFPILQEVSLEEFLLPYDTGNWKPAKWNRVHTTINSYLKRFPGTKPVIDTIWVSADQWAAFTTDRTDEVADNMKGIGILHGTW